MPLDEEVQSALKDIVDECEKEDFEFRKSQIRTWKKNEQFWHGFQYLFWSYVTDNWKSPQDADWLTDFTAEEQAEYGSFSDLVIDIFSPHGQSIIAALSAQLPSVRFLPDDADDDSDVMTARTYNKIVDVLYRHNSAKLVFMQALFYLYINGIVFSYRYKDTDKKYGTYDVPVIENKNQEKQIARCSDCGTVHELNEPCPCGSQNPPETVTTTENVPTQVGTKSIPKSRAKIDVFGPLHVKIPRFARNQDGCRYLILYTDLPRDEAKSIFGDDLEEKIDGEQILNTDRFVQSEHGEPETKDLTTIIQAWLRPNTYWKTSKERRKKLEKLFPDGCHVTFVGKSKIFADAQHENLDDRWTVGKAGLSTYIHSDPICRPLVSIQEMRNNVVNLTEETIRHGIPSDFADPSVIDFDEYGKFEAVPGFLYQAKTKGNAPLSNFFAQGQRATLSKEVPVFQRMLDQDGQFSVGSFPSLYGGPSEGKSRTFSEYAASRQQNLQRLMITWNLITDWWCRSIEGLVRLYVSIMTDDEHYAKTDGNSYLNVWIRKSELLGKVGGVEPEASDAFPISLIQKRDIVQKMMELNNPYVNSALYTPDNARVIQDILALSEFKIPGEIQRVKQSIEISQLSKEEPIEEGPGVWVPSILPEPEIDDDEVHISVLKNFLADQGQDLKRYNPAGYMNCKAHLRLHLMSLQQKTISQVGASPPGHAPDTANVGEGE